MFYKPIGGAERDFLGIAEEIKGCKAALSFFIEDKKAALRPSHLLLSLTASTYCAAP